MNHIKIDLERIVSDIDRNIFGDIWRTWPMAGFTILSRLMLTKTAYAPMCSPR